MGRKAAEDRLPSTWLALDNTFSLKPSLFKSPVPSIIEVFVPSTAVCLFSKELPQCPSEPLTDFQSNNYETQRGLWE